MASADDPPILDLDEVRLFEARNLSDLYVLRLGAEGKHYHFGMPTSELLRMSELLREGHRLFMEKRH